MIIEKPKMAWIGQVVKISPIENADQIQKTEVVCGKGGKWIGVTTKDVKANENVVVFMPDAIVPQIEPLSFMEKHNWRVKMCRLRGCPSEVLIIPISQITKISEIDVGRDVTELLGVKKYEKEIPVNLSGETLGNFPSFIPKTDEDNFQVVPEFREALVGQACFISEKYDGSSLTIYHNDGHFGVCTRNWEKKEDYNMASWQIVKRYELKEKIPQYGNVALQMELIGPGVQKNCLKLTEIDVRVFDAFDIDAQEYFNLMVARQITEEIGMAFVKTAKDISDDITYKDYTDEELRQMADGNYIESDNPREGIVIRPTKTTRVDGRKLSFKVVNLRYKN